MDALNWRFFVNSKNDFVMEYPDVDGRSVACERTQIFLPVQQRLTYQGG